MEDEEDAGGALIERILCDPLAMLRDTAATGGPATIDDGAEGDGAEGGGGGGGGGTAFRCLIL